MRRPIEFALHAPVGMMDQLIADLVFPGKDRHLQRVQRQARPQMLSDLPADNLAGEQVGNECRVRKSAGRVHIGDVSDPAAVRRGRGEVPPQQVSGPRPAGIGHRGARLLPPGRGPGNAQLSHQPLHRAPGHLGALTPQLQPHLPCPVHTAALLAVFPYSLDLLLQPLIPQIARRWLTFTFLRRVIGGGGEFQDRAGRFHPEPVTM